MLESYNNQELIVRSYVDNFDVKNFIFNNMIKKTFPNIPINKLNMGFVGIVSEYLSNAIEDSYYTASLMLNENFVTRAILPDSIYSEAALFDLGYTMANASKCNFGLQIWIDDIIKFAKKRNNAEIWDFYIDKDTKLIIGDYIYRLDYDILISYQLMKGTGSPVFSAEYIHKTKDGVSYINSVAVTNNRFIKNRAFINGDKRWLVLFITAQEYERVTIDSDITDNTVTTASDIVLNWDNHLAGFDVMYETPLGEQIPMKKKIQYTDPEVEPYIYYRFSDDNEIRCSFTEQRNFFTPAFNSKIHFTLYTCHGKAANFDSFDGEMEVIVEKSGLNYEYNVETHMVAVCYSGSTLGTDRKGLEMLRSDVKLAYNTAKVLSTDHDLDEWFNNFAMKYDVKSYFFKRRDDPSGRLFSQFVAITNNSYIYPTNTLSIEVRQSQFDSVDNNNEFIIKPGHLWKYKKGSRDTLIMLGKDNYSSTPYPTSDGRAYITDADIPIIDPNDENIDERFMFVNPFYIKINRVPNINMCYNYLNHSKFAPIETTRTQIMEREFLQFQILTVSVDRTISRKYPNHYIIKANVAPVVDESMIGLDYKYVQGSWETHPNLFDNNLRLVMTIYSSAYGPSGYIEMRPIGTDPSGFITFEGIIAVDDELRTDNSMFVINDGIGDTVTSLITAGPPNVVGRTLIDAFEPDIRFTALVTSNNPDATPYYGDPRFADPETGVNKYMPTNIYYIDSDDLSLYKPMTMMRNILRFSGSVNNYTLSADLFPFLKYNIPLDDEKMTYFIQAFNEQYDVVEPVLFERLDNNCHLDLKFFNTYGKSRNYYYGDSDIMLDSVHLKIAFYISVKDRSGYLTTAKSIKEQIQNFFTKINDAETGSIYISNLIKELENNNPNLDHLRYFSLDDWVDTSDSTKGVLPWTIRAKYTYIDDLSEDELKVLVPEMLQIDYDSIDLIEEMN